MTDARRREAAKLFLKVYVFGFVLRPVVPLGHWLLKRLEPKKIPSGWNKI